LHNFKALSFLGFGNIIWIENEHFGMVIMSFSSQVFSSPLKMVSNLLYSNT